MVINFKNCNGSSYCGGCDPICHGIKHLSGDLYTGTVVREEGPYYILKHRIRIRKSAVIKDKWTKHIERMKNV